MDNTKSFYLLNVGSIPAGEATYGVVSVKVNTTDCDSVNMGSIPVRLPMHIFASQVCTNKYLNKETNENNIRIQT